MTITYRATGKEFSGKGIPAVENNIYIVMNKPVGYVCSAVSDSHKTVYQLLTPELQALVKGAKRGHRLHTVGRLDSETSGLLLFTTDGYFSHYLTSPESGVEKTYKIELGNSVSNEEQKFYIENVEKGIILPAEKKAGEEKAAPGKLEFINDYVCFIKIKEGKFHQVRRTFLALGNFVEKLERVAIGDLVLGNEGDSLYLNYGEYRELSAEEIGVLNFRDGAPGLGRGRRN